MQDILDYFDFADGLIADAKEAKADGDISWLEAVKLVIANAPAGAKAFMGSQEIPEQFHNLDKDDYKVLAERGFKVVQSLVGLFA